MAKKDYQFEVGQGKIADDATISHAHYGMNILLEGVYPQDLLELLTLDEIIENKTLDDLVSGLINKHGLDEVISTIVNNSSVLAVAKSLDEIDDDMEALQYLSEVHSSDSHEPDGFQAGQ